nr:hypothetical protein Iba_chr14bCG12860 [Ipomoea batatas]
MILDCKSQVIVNKKLFILATSILSFDTNIISLLICRRAFLVQSSNWNNQWKIIQDPATVLIIYLRFEFFCSFVIKNNPTNNMAHLWFPHFKHKSRVLNSVSTEYFPKIFSTVKNFFWTAEWHSIV